MLDAISSEGEEEVLGLRAEILGGIGFIDGWLNEVLGGYLGRDSHGREVLIGLLAGVRLEQRCKAVIDLLNQTGEIDDYPFIDLLPPVIYHRNILGHMVLDIFESTDETLVFSGYRKGEWQTKRVKMADLRRTGAVVWHAGIDLSLLGKQIAIKRYEELLDEMRRLGQPGNREPGEPIDPDQLSRYVPFPIKDANEPRIDDW